MVDSVYRLGEFILKKEKTPQVRTPFIQKMFRIGEDDLYGLKTGYITEAKAASAEKQNIPCMRLDDLIMLAEHYALMDVELIELEGGFGILQGKQYLEMLDVFKNRFQIRVSKMGIQPAVADRLRNSVGGFCVDIKLVPKSDYAPEDYLFYSGRFNVKKSLIEYAMMTRRLVEIVDGMDQTYYTCSLLDFLDQDDKKSLLEFSSDLKSPFFGWWSPSKRGGL